MKESSLVELFKTLTTKEIKEFCAYFEAPHFDKVKHRKEAQKILDILAKYAPNGLDSADLAKEKVYKKVFPGEPFVEGRLDKSMGELSKALRTFMTIQHYLRDENQRAVQADFAKMLLERQLPQRASNTIRLLLDDLKALPTPNTTIYELLHRVSSTLYSIETRKNTWKEDLNIGPTLRYLDLYYFSSRLSMLNHYLLLSKLAQVDAGIDIDKETNLQHFFEVSPTESPLIFVAQKVFELYTNEASNPSAIETLLGIIKTYEHVLNELDTKIYYSFLRTYCALLIQGDNNSALLPILYRIQRDNLEKGYFYYEQEIAPGSFLSIVVTALWQGDKDWAYNFIQEHKDRIMGDNNSKDYFQFAMANYYFYTGAFGKSLEYIPPSSPHLEYHLNARRLELMNYYELDSDLLPYKIDAFKMYLSRGKRNLLAKDYYERNNNFLNLLIQIVQSKPGDPKRKETLMLRIEEKKQIMAKDWLVAKVKALK